MKRKCALIYNDPFGVVHFRLELLDALRKAGYEVTVITPHGETLNRLKKHVCCYLYPLDRRNLNPPKDMISFFSLALILAKLKPRVTHSFTLKPNILGVVASWVAGVPKIFAAVTGLGYVFMEDSKKVLLYRKLVAILFGFSFSKCQKIVFKNPDDIKVLFRMGVIDPEKVVLVRGAGVDVNRFSPNSVDISAVERFKGKNRSDLRISFIGRLVWDKGIREFVETARLLRRFFPSLDCLVAGPIDRGNPAAVDSEILAKWIADGVIRYVGAVDEVKELYWMSNIFLLPSKGEGLPTVLLEASAMRVPSIAVAIAGCIQAVESGRTGMLFKDNSPQGLVEGVKSLLSNPRLQKRMGWLAREKVLREFTREMTVKRYLSMYGIEG